jgi:flavodoxin II
MPENLKACVTKAPIGLFYGSSTCYTEMVAEKIVAELRETQGNGIIDIYNVVDEPVTTMESYDFLILGIPTWDYGELQEDWENIWDDIDHLDLAGKTVALFGLGDQVGYPEWFLDALGYLWAKVCNQGAKTVGYWPVDGFEFEQSKALTADEQNFVGLAIDDENQFELTDDRITNWCQQILKEFGLNSSKN